MTLWFAFENDGHVYELNGLAEKELVGTGANGYPTEQDALAHRNKPANAYQASLLADFVFQASLPIGGGSMGVLAVYNTTAPPPGPGQQNAPANQVTNTGQVKGPLGSISNPLGFLAGIGDFFTRLGQANTWIRVAEVLLGAGLIIVGLSHLVTDTGVGKTATKIAKAAQLL